MRVSKDGASLNSRLFEALRAEIIGGELLPGQRLKVAALATLHDVSLNVVREALNRLAGEKLVDFEPQQGFTVRSLSAEDLEDLVDQRVIFEGLALRRCIERSSIEWQSEVLAAHHRLDRTPLLVDKGATKVLNPQWVARHDEFHSVMLQGCSSPRLFQMIRQMAEAAEMYHRALLPAVNSDSQRDSEHRELLEAVLEGDADRAVRVLTTHVERTRDLMLPLLKRGAGGNTVAVAAPALAGITH